MTAVFAILVGKDRQYNRRLLQMCSHHLVEPVASTPASGCDKGQVENQIGLARERRRILARHRGAGIKC